MFNRRKQCANCQCYFHNCPKDVQDKMETECSHEIDQDTNEHCPIFQGTDEWQIKKDLKMKCWNLIDGEHHNLVEGTRTANDLYQYLASAYEDVTEELAEELFNEIFYPVPKKKKKPASISCSGKKLKPKEEVIDTGFMIEELQDMFDFSKERATEILEMCIKVPIMLKLARGRKHSYESFIRGYESDDDTIFGAWKDMVEVLDRDFKEVSGKLAFWEMNKSFNSLVSLCERLNKEM